MRTMNELTGLLDELNAHSADSLEEQDLDFKAWDPHSSMDRSVKMVIAMAICMANGGGGTVVFGSERQGGGPLSSDPRRAARGGCQSPQESSVRLD